MSLHPSYRHIGREPSWQPVCRVSPNRLTPGERAWLLDDGSLTARLSALGDFQVRRLYQDWQFPLPSERRLLNQPIRQLALVREVALTLDGKPVVFARSVFPHSSLTGRLAHLRRLHNQSLGAILFRDPAMQRSPFEVAWLEGGSDYLPAELRQSAGTWGRRSRFTIDDRDLMVSEIFLQGFKPWPASTGVARSLRGRISTA